jgi:hypothetical protein
VREIADVVVEALELQEQAADRGVRRRDLDAEGRLDGAGRREAVADGAGAADPLGERIAAGGAIPIARCSTPRCT